MTTYYKGNNIGLNYDAANATWSFINEPQDFIDTNAFSSTDPAFDYTPPPTDDDEQEEDTNCPEGYIYDSTLKQCVPDPAVQNRYMQQNQGGGSDRPPVRIAGTDRYTTDNNFIATDAEYDNMSAEEFVENYKQRGMVGKDENGSLFIDLSKMAGKGNILDSLFGRFQNVGKEEAIKKGDIPRPTTESEASVRKSLKYMFDKNIAHSDLNPDAFNFYVRPGQFLTSENMPLTKLFEKDKENYKIILPTKQSKNNIVSGKTGTEVVGGWGNKIFDTSHGIYDRGENIIPNNRFTETLNKWTNYANLTTNASSILQTRLDNEAKLKAEKIKQAEIKTQRENTKLQREIEKANKERDMQQIIKDAEEQQAKKEKDEDKRKKDEDKLREDLAKDISSQVPSSAQGTTLGSSVHGTGSYNPGGSSSNNQGSSGVTGTSVHGGAQYTAPKKSKTCFHPEQLIGNKFIKDLEPGDLINGIKILGMVKLKLDEDMYSLNNVKVTGTHKVKYNNTWMYVSNHPESFKINDKPEFVYVPIVEGGTFIINNNEFADYDDEHIETLDNKLKVA